MSFPPREIGTLIAVVLKAKNLPNKKHIGKQAPYCLLTLNEDKRRTKVIKRGGQHPEWDEEFRFHIFEDVEGGLVRSAPGSDIPPPLPPKKKGPKKIKGGNFMRLQCYADDARDPDFIGEALVDLTEALTKGETDEWFTLMNKDKYAGEVYLELTFWSNEPPPEKKSSQKQTISNRNYGGPGSFVPANGSSSSLNGSSHPTLRVTPTGSSQELNHLDSLPSSLRAFDSRPELYAPPYEQRNRVPSASVEQVANDFAELGVIDHRTQESYPNPHQTIRPSTSSGLHSLPLPHSQSYEQQGQVEGSDFAYDDVVPPTTPQSRHSIGPSYHLPYENGAISTYTPPVRNHGPRYSMPAAPSGYVPVSNVSASPTYGSVSPYSPEPSKFNSPQGHPSHSPSQPNPPAGYSPHRHQTYSAYPPASATPAPFSTPPPSTVAPQRISLSLSTPQLPDYHSYRRPASVHELAVAFPTQPMEYGNPIPPPTPVHSAPPQMYPVHAPLTPSPSREYPSLVATPSSSAIGSRPLPQPGQAQRDRRYSVAVVPSSSFPQQLTARIPSQPANAAFPSSGSYPPVPPIPPNYRRIPSAPGHLPPPDNSRPPPLPIPPSQIPGNPPPRTPGLPQHLVGYQPVQPMYQSLPPPPLPPMSDVTHHAQLTSSHSSSFSNNSHFQGPLPRPPQPHPNYGQPFPTPRVHGDR